MSINDLLTWTFGIGVKLYVLSIGGSTYTTTTVVIGMLVILTSVKQLEAEFCSTNSRRMKERRISCLRVVCCISRFCNVLCANKIG